MLVGGTRSPATAVLAVIALCLLALLQNSQNRKSVNSFLFNDETVQEIGSKNALNASDVNVSVSLIFNNQSKSVPVNNKVSVNSSTDKVYNKFFELNPDKFLLYFPLRTGGLSNQLSCFYLVANLAIRYNRTLMLPPFGYLPNHTHDRDNVTLLELFDEIRVSYQIASPWMFNKRRHKIPKVKFAPEPKAAENLWNDPYPNLTMIRLDCNWCYEYRTLSPPTVFPHLEQVLFPYHSSFRDQAEIYVQEMKQRCNKTDATPFRFLSMQIRLGDKGMSHPLLSCADSFRYANGTDSNCNYVSPQQSRLQWPAYLKQAMPILSKDYDAIFIATNRPGEVRGMENMTLPNLFFLEDFSKLEGNVESIRRFVVEQIMIVMSDRLIPSIPTSITGQIMRMRLSEQRRNHKSEDPYDVELHKAFWGGVNATYLYW